MPANKKILVLPGDGIGPEVMCETERVMDWFAKRRSFSYEVSRGLVGGSAYDAEGVSITDETVADAMASDAVLFGSVGGPKWDTMPFDKKPERGLLRLRKEMDLFSNLRPAQCFDALADFSSLKKEPLSDVDYTYRQNVNRARGLPPGKVFLAARKTIHLRVDTARLKRLLSRETVDLSPT